MMLRSIHFTAFFFIVLAFSLPSSAHAYIGPGVGLGAIATTIALILGVVLLAMGLVWYPLKRLFKGLKKDAEKTGKAQKQK